MRDVRQPFLLIILMCVVLLPRLVGLGDVVTADENLWVNRSVRFIHALLDLDLAATAQTAHPGVITMWVAGVAIAVRTLMGDYSWLDFYPVGQFAVALTTAACLIGCFFLLRRLAGQTAAFVAVMLLAFDPFFLAHSRILHLDALLASLMLLSVLFFCVWIQSPLKIRYAASAGLFGGLALLAKIPAVFLLPFFALATVGTVLFRKFSAHGSAAQDAARLQLGAVTRGSLLMLLAMCATAFVFYPAHWADPLLLARSVLGARNISAHEHGQFVLGSAVADPGAAMYILVLLFRTTPITLLAPLSLSGVLVLRCFRNPRQISAHMPLILILLLYVAFFTIFVAVVPKKMDRYLLPVFPALDVIAGLGLSHAINFATTRWPRRMGVRLAGLVIASAIVIHAWPAVSLHPHHLAYYNPLVGGSTVAPRVLLIGRGEGLDIAAAYLNSKPNPKALIVATEFPEVLEVHFKGKTLTTKTEQYNPDTLSLADYLIVYISGLQKGVLRLPQEVLQYHLRHVPERTIVLNNIEYAYIYRLR